MAIKRPPTTICKSEVNRIRLMCTLNLLHFDRMPYWTPWPTVSPPHRSHSVCWYFVQINDDDAVRWRQWAAKSDNTGISWGRQTTTSADCPWKFTRRNNLNSFKNINTLFGISHLTFPLCWLPKAPTSIQILRLLKGWGEAKTQSNETSVSYRFLIRPNFMRLFPRLRYLNSAPTPSSVYSKDQQRERSRRGSHELEGRSKGLVGKPNIKFITEVKAIPQRIENTRFHV